MKKLISSRSKKEMENCIGANLRIITWETVFQKALRTISLFRGQSTVIFETKGYSQLTVYIIQIYTWVLALYKIKKEGYLVYEIKKECYLLKRSG